MTPISVTRAIAAPAGEVWAVLARYGDVAAFSPHLAGSAILPGGPPTGVGALRQCDPSNGSSYIRERVTDWREGASYRVEIYEGSMPIRAAFSTAGVKSTGPSSSEAKIEIGYSPEFGIAGRLLDLVLLRSRLTAVALDNLAGLDRYVAQRTKHRSGIGGPST